MALIPWTDILQMRTGKRYTIETKMQNGRSSRFVWCDAIIEKPTQHVYLIARYLGAIIGRTCDRIADGKFSLEGEDYQVPTFKKTGFLGQTKTTYF